MIIGIGIDSVAIARIEKWSEPMRLRFFGKEEKLNAEQKPYVSASLAACFAAKEAFGKALGVGIFGMPLKEIQLLNYPSGAPYLTVSEAVMAKVKTIQEAFSIGAVHVSITHEGTLAIACVLVGS